MKKNVVLAAALIALMTGVLSAQTYDSESDFQVTKMATAVTITKYVGKKTAVSIPPRIQNLPVTVIGEEAFNEYGDSDITSITIPNGVTSIGGGAFISLFNLTSVTIPNSVTTIGQSAFQDCKSLTNVTIPNNVTSIGLRAFYRCTSLISVTFGGTIPSAGFNATNPFDGDLRTKYLAAGGGPGTYTRPDDKSTTWTKAAATTPATTTAPGTTTTAPAATAQYDSESDFQVTTQVAGNPITIQYYKGTKTAVSIPPTIQNLPVTAIGLGAFRNKTSITSVTIPSSVTSIGNTAFSGCTSLASITIPDGVTIIDQGAFNSCASLASVTIPNGVTSIGNSAFSGCTSLASVTIPDNVTSIGNNAFTNCTSLTSVTFNGTIPSSGVQANAFGTSGYNGYLGDLRDKYLAGGIGTYTRPDGKSTTWTKK